MVEVTKTTKRRQGDGRPLGEMPPLGDRAPIDIICDWRGSSFYRRVKTTLDLFQPPRSPRAWHVIKVGVGTWEIQLWSFHVGKRK